MSQDDQDHFIYSMKDPRDNLVYYIGRTDNPSERYKHHIGGYSSNERMNKWIEQLIENGLLPIMEIVEAVKGRELGKKQEVHWIKLYSSKLAPLLNLKGLDAESIYNPLIKDNGEWIFNPDEIKRLRDQQSNRLVGAIVYAIAKPIVIKLGGMALCYLLENRKSIQSSIVSFVSKKVRPNNGA